MGVEVVTTVRGRQKSPKTSIQVEAPDHAVEEIRMAVQRSLNAISSAAGQGTLGLDEPDGHAKKGKKRAVDGNGVVQTPADGVPAGAVVGA